MIDFNVILNREPVKQIPKGYPELIEYEVNFKILIDGRLFFEEPNFPLLEFLFFVKEWKNHNHASFEYVSIETEDNPLICFKCEKDMWAIYSPWQLFECKTKFTKEQIVSALDTLEKKIIVNQEHKGTVSGNTRGRFSD